MFDWTKKIFGDPNEKELKRLQPIVEKISSYEPDILKLDDEKLKNKTPEFKERLDKGETLDDILPEVFAVVREVAKRVTKMRPFDVQLIGGIILHQGKIVEMATGEGKTLVATMPAYLNALSGNSVHIVTVNDYLAKRDRHWMGGIYESLGLKVGLIQHDMRIDERKKAYQADITYGTNNEFGFDYLRDNMAVRLEDVVQKGYHFAIVDEVDSILIDEARTPLIISGPSDESTKIYQQVNRIATRLQGEVDYKVYEKEKTVALIEEGVSRIEGLLQIKNLYDEKNMNIQHHIIQALKAQRLFKRDVDYIVKNGEVIIVDEFTGRLMFGRRYSDGLHQAIEAKEGVVIARENQTLATITFQNYFRLYKKLSGMTGTAKTEEEEFIHIYNLPVVVIPPNKKLIRNNCADV
ncbi:preprotein translocase subunit SecA, partial [bacterium]|nr:preprotein translocase subunit SecA [bacterium]